MAISEFEIFKVEKAAKDFCQERNKNYPPDQLSIEYRLEDQTLYFIEVRPRWNDPSVKTEMDLAKLRYIKKVRKSIVSIVRYQITWLLAILT